MAKFTAESVAKQVGYRLALIERLEKAGKAAQAEQQKRYHAKRVELSEAGANPSAFWISARDLDARFPELRQATPAVPVAAPVAEAAPSVAAKSKKGSKKASSKTKNSVAVTA